MDFSPLIYNKPGNPLNELYNIFLGAFNLPNFAHFLDHIYKIIDQQISKISRYCDQNHIPSSKILRSCDLLTTYIKKNYFALNARYPPALWQPNITPESERTNNIAESGNKRFKNSLKNNNNFNTASASLKIKSFHQSEIRRASQHLTTRTPNTVTNTQRHNTRLTAISNLLNNFLSNPSYPTRQSPFSYSKTALRRVPTQKKSSYFSPKSWLYRF